MGHLTSCVGDLQSTLLAMRDSACEVSVALSAYGGIIRGHSDLTSECGSMLEEVLAITEALHDVHSLGKEAAVLHYSLMENLSKANAILLPLESLLSKDVAAMTEAMGREKGTNSEISPIHGQAIFQSYHNRIKEALQGFKPLVAPLALSVKDLYSVLTRLARAAGLHAGNLHKALEGLGENLQVRSQDVDPSREDLAGHGVEYDTQESGLFPKSDGENEGDSDGLNGLALPDGGWISPPESINSGSTESGVTSAEASTADIFIGLGMKELQSGGSDREENGECIHYLPSHVTEEQDSHLGETESKNFQESSELVHKDEASLLNQDKAEEEWRETSFNNIGTTHQAYGGKNAYAMSILRRVEMKLDGKDITENREISIAEQVDFLLKQATNIDNLCNMYEGWTPWI